MKRMKKQLFLWLMLCLSFQNGFNQTVDYSGVYKASLTFVGFKFAEQTLILKKAANNSYSGSIQAHPANENSMIKADIDTSIYELNNIYIQNGELNYKVDKMTTKPSFKGRFTDNNNRIEGKWTEETNTKKIIYIKEIGYELYDSNHNENTRNSAHINNSTDERTVLSYSDIFRARIEDVTKEQELTYAFDDHGYIDVKQLPLLDCDLANELRMGYQSDSTKVFVIPDNEVDMEELNKNFKSLSWTKFSIKTESELYAADYKKLLVFTAPLKSYKHWDKYGLPIQKTKSGFSYNNINYSNENDGIEYYSWNRIVKSGNSWQIIKKLNKSFYHGYFRFVIFQNGQLSKYGLFDNRVIDMERIVNSNYDFISTDFYNILISKKLYFETQRFDPIVINICHKLELELPDLKMEAQIHDVPNSTRLFSCFFPLTGCDILPDSFGFHGTVVMDVIHSTGSGLDFFEHESFHLVWEKQVGPPGGNNIFLNEGIQTYYSFLNDSSNLNSVIKIALKHKDFDITNLVLQKNLLDFWNSASKAYPISGLFVKMLIDKYGGLNKFKEFFVYPDTEKGYEVIYNTSAKEVIDDYYNTLNCYE
ncbi:MAG: hypothetical protein JW894_01900 [Bacteroidales bacterium]|nr:hypothetical protein [Bacteroidales bacterium]